MSSDAGQKYGAGLITLAASKLANLLPLSLQFFLTKPGRDGCREAHQVAREFEWRRQVSSTSLSDCCSGVVAQNRILLAQVMEALNWVHYW
jgi:hypothetical protein